MIGQGRVALVSLQQEVLAMPEWGRLVNIRQFSLSLEIFKGNANQLISKLEAARQGPAAVELWALENRPQLFQFQREVARLLHNFVAGAFSLVDHARKFYKDNYKDTGEFGDYEAEVKTRFADVPLCQFVQGLRNYFVHKQIPSISGNLEMKQGAQPVHSILLDKAQLSADFDWSSRAKEYLASAPSKLDLLVVAQEYLKTVLSFYEWVFLRLKQIHAKDTEAVDAKQQQLRTEFGKLVPERINSDLNILKKIRTKPEGMLAAYMDPDELRSICEAHANPVDRATALLDNIGRYAMLPTELREHVIDAFKAYYDIA